MKIILGRQIEEIKKNNSEAEKILLKNRNSEDINELDDDDVYFHSNAIKNIKLGAQLVSRIYLNHSIVYELKDTIDLNLFHSLVPSATATSIIFDKLENQDISGYNLVGYCDANNNIAVYNNNTEYLVLNIRNAVNYAPYDCYKFFYNYKVLSNCVLHYFSTSNVTNMSYMFFYCNSLTSLDVSNFNTSNVTNMSYMFFNCNSLTSLDVSNFNTSNVSLMSCMFSGCRSLTSLDVSNFDTSNLIYISYMFERCSSLTSLDVSNFNISKVKDLSSMFYYCSSLTSLNVRNFNISKVDYMNNMFENCSSLTSLDISDFNTSHIYEMKRLFYSCKSLKFIISNTFTTRPSLKSDYMFMGCSSIVGGDGTVYNSSHVTAEYARIDGENGLPGYFTAPPATNNNK